jgi:hypothetical protein
MSRQDSACKRGRADLGKALRGSHSQVEKRTIKELAVSILYFGTINGADTNMTLRFAGSH